MEIEQIVALVRALDKPKDSSSPKHPLTLNTNYFIRTVTLYYTGRLKEIVGDWLVLEDATWIADTGRFHDFLKDGLCNEYESFVSSVRIPIGSIIDVTEWNHELFKGQK